MSVLPKSLVRTRTISPRSATTVVRTPEATGGVPVGPRLVITYQPISSLKPASRQLRRRGKKYAAQLKASIGRLGCRLPVLATRAGEIIDGHEIAAACKSLGYDTIPTIIVDDLSPVEIRALRLSLNKIAESSEWDPDALGAELAEIFAIDPLLLDFTGFTMPEFDRLITGIGESAADEPESLLKPTKTAVSRLGDLWEFGGGHKLLCASARESMSYEVLLGSAKAQMVIADPPYGCAIKGHVSHSHDEFVEGSGMTATEAQAFFESFLAAMTPFIADGAIVDIFIDWRGMLALLQALRGAGLEQKSLVFWDKGGGGMGSPYRQQGEFVVITKWGKGPHIDNIQLGKHGRNRTTLWQAPGLAQFGKGRKEALALHPTVKPVSLIMDALLDTSHPGGIVLDPFGGSGTTLLAAHRTGRIGRAIELDPIYIDVAIRRMEALTGQPARHEATGLTFETLARQRSHQDAAAPSSSPVPTSL